MTIFDEIKKANAEQLNEYQEYWGVCCGESAERLRDEIGKRREVLTIIELIKSASREELLEVLNDTLDSDEDEIHDAINDRFEAMKHSEEVEETDRNTAAYSYSVR